MTLQAYSPPKIEELALRLLDLAATLRGLAQDCRAEGLEQVELHDKKALEWIEKLEEWTLRTRSEKHLKMLKIRGSRLAQQRLSRPG